MRSASWALLKHKFLDGGAAGHLGGAAKPTKRLCLNIVRT